MKWIGICLIDCSVLLYGLVRHRMLKKRAENQRWLLRLIEYLAEQIATYHLPLSEIYADFAKEAVAGGPEWGEILEKEGAQGLLLYMEREDLPKESRNVLRELLGRLGGSGKNEQMTMLNQYKQQMEQISEIEERELADRLRINRTVTICVALTVIILMW